MDKAGATTTTHDERTTGTTQSVLPAPGENLGDGYLTIREAAERCGLGIKTLRRAVQEGTLPRRYAATRYGAQLIVTPQELDHWQAERQATALVRARHPVTTPQAWTALETRLTRHQTELERVRAQGNATARALADLQARHDETTTAVQALGRAVEKAPERTGFWRRLALALGLAARAETEWCERETTS